jgi:hypothetical protein
MKPPRHFSLSPGLLLAARFLLGVAVGVFLHYLLYRISLPVTPFIYVAF